MNAPNATLFITVSCDGRECVAEKQVYTPWSLPEGSFVTLGIPEWPCDSLIVKELDFVIRDACIWAKVVLESIELDTNEDYTYTVMDLDSNGWKITERSPK